MDNFDLKKYLVKNKLTFNSKGLSENNENTDNERYYGKDGYWEKYIKRYHTGITVIVDELVKDFNLEHKIHFSKGLDVNPPSSKVWTRYDGSRYKDPGSIQGSYVDEFWKWMQNKPGVKQIGKVGGSFQSDQKMDSIQYKGMYLSKRTPELIIFGSMSRLKSGGGAWNKGAAWSVD